MNMALRPQRLAQPFCRLGYIRPITTTARSLSRSAGPPKACVFCRFHPPRPQIFSRPSQSVTIWPSAIARRHASANASASPAEGDDPTISGGPDITNHYTIFPKTIPAGPPPAAPFTVSLRDLRREFLQLQNIVHPDKYPPGAAKQHAEALSARINEAYRTLADPLQRAQYLLREWHGIDVTAEDAASKHTLDPETLVEVMEVQETIEEVGAAPEAEAQINALKEENNTRVEECMNALAQAFDEGDIEAARKECVRLRFWYSVGEGLREWEPGKTEIRLFHTS